MTRMTIIEAAEITRRNAAAVERDSIARTFEGCACGAVIEPRFRDVASALHETSCPLYDAQGE